MDRAWMVRGALPSILRTPVRVIGLHVGMLLSRRIAFEGIVVTDMTLDEGGSAQFAKVAAALQLIRTTDPRRFFRLRRDVKRVVLSPAAGSAGEYWPHFDALVLDSGYVKNVDQIAIAGTLVHEATHARLHQAGIPYSLSLRERIERRCVAEEVAFVKHFPGSEGLVQGALERLKTAWWTGEHGRQQHDRVLDVLGTPKWLRWVTGAARRRAGPKG